MATKASANAFNSFFYQQTNQQHNSQTSQAASNAKLDQMNASIEPVSDLHLKMSKKIAQLTKVIYALNSKNDESENLIATIRAQYDEEKEQLVHDMNKRLEEYKFRFMNMNDQSGKVSELETRLKEYQKQKERMQNELDQLKLTTIENEENLTLIHKQELIDLNKMMEHLRQEQDKQSKMFEDKCKQFESERAYQVEDLKSKHRLDIEALKQQFNWNKENFNMDKEILQEKYEKEINKLNEEINQLNSRMSKEKLDYDQNMQKLKLFHEKELDAFKQNSSSEYQMLINKLKKDLEELTKKKVESETELSKSYNLKLEEIVSKEEEISLLKEEINQLKSKQSDLETNLKNLNINLIDVNGHKQQLETKLNELLIEKNSLVERCDKQSRNLLEKSSVISKLEAGNMQKTSMINDLNSELTLVRDRLKQLEDERKSLENENLSLNDKQSKIIKQLESKLETLNNEKLTELNVLNKKIVEMNELNKSEMDKLRKIHSNEIDGLIEQHEAKLNMEKVSCDQKILELQNSLNKNFNHENQKLLSQQLELKSQLDKLLEEMKIKSRLYETEVKSLNEKLTITETNLTQATSLSMQLKTDKDDLERELKVVKELSIGQKKQIDELLNELEKSKFLYETTSKDSQLELKVKLEQLTKELNSKWSETLRLETDSLRQDLLRLKEEEKLFELTKLANLKEEEITNLKLIWQAKTNELLKEISDLKQELNEREVREKEKYDSIKNVYEAENRILVEKFNRLNDDYQIKIDHLQSQQNQEQKVLIDNLIKENEAKLEELKARHLEDLKCQTMAQKSALSALKTKLEKTKELELEMQLQEHNKKLETAKYEMEQHYYTEIDRLKNENETEMLAIRDEIDKTNDSMKQKERDFDLKFDQFQTDLKMKQKQINKLNDELVELKSYNMSLLDQIDQKNIEIRQIKHDVQEELKNKERLMQHQLREEINNINAENMRQKQLLVNEFIQAQELLKQKIIETEKELRELHDRYMNRESRPEDLEQIKLLKQKLNEYEEKFRMLKDEKKYFQMELLNRENNFNKMFNNIPNVGVINPLNATTKIKPKQNGSMSSISNQSKQSSTSQFQNASLIGRLDPIPGVESPLHDLNLNPNKILPKKFLS